MSSKSCDRDQSVDLCELGIQKKRQGDYEAALSFYAQAKNADYSNPDVYKNSSKILLGTNRNDEALRHILTYVHLNIVTNRYDPNTPVTAFSVPQIDLVMDEYNWSGTIDGLTTIPDSYVPSRCAMLGHLQLVAIEIDMCANAGICYARIHDDIVSQHGIPSSMFQSQSQIYLGIRPSSQMIRESKYEHLINVIGFAFLDENLSLEEKNPERICDLYFDKSRQLKPISIRATPEAPKSRDPMTDLARQTIQPVFNLPPAQPKMVGIQCHHCEGLNEISNKSLQAALDTNYQRFVTCVHCRSIIDLHKAKRIK